MNALRQYKCELERHLEVVFLCLELMDCLNEDTDFDSCIFFEKIKALASFGKESGILQGISRAIHSDHVFSAGGEEVYIERVLQKMQQELFTSKDLINSDDRHEELAQLTDMLLVFLDQLNAHIVSMMREESHYA